MIFTAILVAVAYVFVAHDNEEKVKSFKNLVEALKEIIFKILDWVIELTPYAVLTLVATSVGNGINSSGMLLYQVRQLKGMHFCLLQKQVLSQVLT